MQQGNRGLSQGLTPSQQPQLASLRKRLTERFQESTRCFYIMASSAAKQLSHHSHEPVARESTNTCRRSERQSEPCEHYHLTESIPHLLFTCSKWQQLRENMRGVHGKRYSELSYALRGCSDAERDGQLSKWKPDLKTVKATIKFVLATKRLDYVPTGDMQPSQTQNTGA